MQIESLPTNQRKRAWHPLRGRVGTIVGLPSFSGELIATDGILCQILTPHGRVVEGHLQFFEESSASSFGAGAGAYASTKTTTKRKAPKALAAYC